MITHVIAVLLLAGVMALPGAELLLRPAADTTLFEGFPDHNLGASTLAAGRTLAAGPARTRMLLRFDVAGALPMGAIITNATLELSVVRRPMYGPVASDFDLFRVLVSWSEGNKAGGLGEPASLGETTWNARHHGSNSWAAPGGLAGTDFTATSRATIDAVDALGDRQFPSSPALVADVQHWLDRPHENFGWIIISRSEGSPGSARRFADRGDPFSSARLRLGYLAPPQITQVRQLPDEIEFTFLASSNQSHTVQWRSNLMTGSWLLLINLPAAPASTQQVIRVAPTYAPFYRVFSY